MLYMYNVYVATICLFIFGLFLLLVGSRSLIRSVYTITYITKISPLILGATLVAIGTSLPEITISLLGGLEKAPGIALGDILGSNIVNIGLIFGLSLLVSPLHIGSKKTQRNMFVMLLATTTLFLLLFTNQFTPSWGVMFISLGIGAVFWEMYQGKKEKVADENLGTVQGTLAISFIFFLLSLSALLLGGKLLIDAGEKLALMFHVPDVILGATLVAIGTSLPELTISLVALGRKGSSVEEKLVVGNILGSNIFNIFFGAGILGLFGVSRLPLVVSLIAFIVFTFLFSLLLYGFRGTRVPRMWGISFLLLYGVYLYFLLR